MQPILNRRSRVLQIAAALFPLVAFAATARADIFQWEYINPADPSQGKQQSTTLCPGGAGLNAVPGANLSYRNLTMAYLIGADLKNAYGYQTNLTNADLSQANLTNADFFAATLTDAEFTDADVRGANLGYTGLTLAQLYSTASYAKQDLTGVGLRAIDLTVANFAGQNLTNANFDDARLIGADFTAAEVRGADFSGTTARGFMAEQLYSTASYQSHDLTGIILVGNNLTGCNFAGQNLTNASFSFTMLTAANFRQANLTNADFSEATLTGADFSQANLTNASFSGAVLTDANFTGAEVRGASFFNSTPTGFTLAQLYSTASYMAHDLTGIGLGGSDLSGANFAGQNLTNADFVGATLTGADFTGAKIRGANFRRTTPGGFTAAQLYSTASYQAHDLAGIGLGDDLTGWNFAGQNLANADFRAGCRPQGCAHANLADADLTAANARGAIVYVPASAVTTNLIRSDGHINGLDLDSDNLLVVRDYDGDPNRFDYDDYGDSYRNPIPPIPITVDQHLAMGPAGTLRMVFEADAWDSTISFTPGIPVTLGGTLELTFADDVNLASQLGRTFDLFDWTGVNPTGAFAISSPYAWNLSNLYTTGEVTLISVPEPSTLLLIAFGLAAMFPMRRVVHRRRGRVLPTAALFPLVAFAATARADIFQWEYINPADPSQGKQQSTTLCPGGAGLNAVPGANLSYRNLTMAYLIGADLKNAYGYQTNLTNADLSQANLTNADFFAATLTGADFTGAEVRGATLGISAAQLYSTASYQAHDLTGIAFEYRSDLTGWSFAGQNLSNALVVGATLTDANFTDAEVRGANFGKIRCIRGGALGTGLAFPQLYSTASYRAHDLTGIDLVGNDLSGANFVGQILVNAKFVQSFDYCFDVCDPIYATLTDADFTAADARGAVLHPWGAITTNLIWPDGHINGLDLDASGLLVVRDYDGDSRPFHSPLPPVPIKVYQHLAMGPAGTLGVVFEADAWDSTISFAAGIPVALGGTLELTFAGDVNLAGQVGRTFDLFDWTGVSPTGAFAVSSPYAWNLSNLYTTGEVTLTAIPEPGTSILCVFALPLILQRRISRRASQCDGVERSSMLLRDFSHSST